jgi:hypothetical protein
MPRIIFFPTASPIGTMPSCECTISYIDIVPHRSVLGEASSTSWGQLEGGELDRMQQEDMQQHMVVEEFIAYVWRE